MTRLILTAFLFAITMGPAFGTVGDDSRVFDFAVKLDGEDIGYHRFRIEDDSGLLRVTSEAKFDVRFLFDLRFYFTISFSIPSCLQRYSYEYRYYIAAA